MSSPTQRLEELVIQFVSSLCEGKLLELQIPRISDFDIIHSEDYHEPVLGVHRTLQSPDCSRRYSQFFAVTALVSELLASIFASADTKFLTFLIAKKTISQRDVYYVLKGIFKTQKECNSIIIELGLVLGLKRCKNNILLLLLLMLLLRSNGNISRYSRSGLLNMCFWILSQLYGVAIFRICCWKFQI
jgi:DNA topoisomerase VI subunit A